MGCQPEGAGLERAWHEHGRRRSPRLLAIGILALALAQTSLADERSPTRMAAVDAIARTMCEQLPEAGDVRSRIGTLHDLYWPIDPPVDRRPPEIRLAEECALLRSTRTDEEHAIQLLSAGMTATEVGGQPMRATFQLGGRMT